LNISFEKEDKNLILILFILLSISLFASNLIFENAKEYVYKFIPKLKFLSIPMGILPKNAKSEVLGSINVERDIAVMTMDKRTAKVPFNDIGSYCQSKFSNKLFCRSFASYAYLKFW